MAQPAAACPRGASLPCGAPAWLTGLVRMPRAAEHKPLRQNGLGERPNSRASRHASRHTSRHTSRHLSQHAARTAHRTPRAAQRAVACSHPAGGGHIFAGRRPDGAATTAIGRRSGPHI